MTLEPSRRRFLGSAASLVASVVMPSASQQNQVTQAKPDQGTGTTFEWQLPTKDRLEEWRNYSFNAERWWGEFSKALSDDMDMFADNAWAVGPFEKYGQNPVLSPTSSSWDSGRFSGGVHNGSILVKDGIFYYVYRGERPIDIPQVGAMDYICDIGVATSRDGSTFVKDTIHSPFFRKGEDRRFSYEDVNVVQHEDTYYLFCNQWLWGDQDNPRLNGTFLATSKDLLNWQKMGIVFPDAKRIHRNAVVLQDPQNRAIRVNGKFVMYVNGGLIAYSEDMMHWDSHENENRWPGGECCFALGEYSENRDSIILFTGGAHCGHFYAVGEVLISRSDVTKPLRWLPRSPLFAETKYPFENGFSASQPRQMVSSFADCIFFNGLTRHGDHWWLYYGGSEYYTCLATASVKR